MKVFKFYTTCKIIRVLGKILVAVIEVHITNIIVEGMLHEPKNMKSCLETKIKEVSKL